jgi:L-2,4-diaminobutyrate decarboxylase
MVSAEAHYSISRAVRIMGLGEQGIIKVPVNESLQLDVARLEETYALAKAHGIKVIALVGNACSTSTGTFDPLSEMADFALAHGLWFHVDGAHGGAAVLSENYRHLVNGIERADSLVIDFHKMMLTPALTTAVIFGNGKHSFETFAQKAEYLLAEKGQNKWYDGAARTLECTKKMMGVKVYAMLRFYGEQLFSDYITAAYDLGQLFAETIRLEKGFELAVQPDCNIICFRYIPNNFMGDINNLTSLVRKKILADGRFYVVQTIVKGQTYIRVSLMNPFTTISDLKSMMDIVRKLAENTTDEA